MTPESPLAFVLSRSLVVACLLAAVPAGTAPAPLEAQEVEAEELRHRTRTLREAAVSIRSIDVSDTDYADLAALKESIGNARVVVLGEATHGDGATFRAKARIVRFLHQEMGFDVLAWEAGLLDAEGLNRTLSGNQPLDVATRQIMSGGWQNSALVRPVFEYARRSWKTGRPLLMTGFDGGRPPHGGAHYVEVLDALLAADSELLPELGQRDRIEGLIARATAFIGAGPDVTDEERAEQRRALFELNAALEDPSATVRGRFSARRLDLFREAFGLLATQERTAWFQKKGIDTEDPAWFMPVNFVRDGEMAHLLEWLVTERYRGHRIIVWTATAHMAREASSIVSLDDPDSYDRIVLMGDHVARSLKTPVYTIGFTAYQGRRGVRYPESRAERTRVSDISDEPPPVGSFEEVAHRLAKPYLFVDLRGLPRDHWMRREAVAWPLGYNASRTRWDLTLDAFFFIDTQEPDVKVGAEAGSSGEERPAGQRPARRRCPTIPEG